MMILDKSLKIRVSSVFTVPGEEKYGSGREAAKVENGRPASRNLQGTGTTNCEDGDSREVRS